MRPRDSKCPQLQTYTLQKVWLEQEQNRKKGTSCLRLPPYVPILPSIQMSTYQGDKAMEHSLQLGTGRQEDESKQAKQLTV
jgi:hypothetical protein